MADDVIVINGRGGIIKRATISFNLTQFKSHVRVELTKRMMQICEMVKVQVQRNISVSSRAAGPSLSGEMPHADTGRLRNSIFWELDPATLRGIVGTPLLYGLWLEYGTQGSNGQKVYPSQGRALSWIDAKTGERVFVAWVIVPPLLPRPFLRRTLVEMSPRIASVMSRPFPDMPSNLKTRVGA